MNIVTSHVTKQQPTIDDIDRRRREVVDKFYEFKNSLQTRKFKLEATKQFIQFKRLVDELVTWVTDKFDILKEQSLQDSSNLSIAKQKLLAFEVEIAAHQDVLSKLFQLYSRMKDDENFVLGNAKELYHTAEIKYSELQTACQLRSDELKSLSEKLQFMFDADEMILSISQKLEEVESTNYGSNLDEVCELQTKFKAFSKVCFLH
ncbi:Spectrin alpha chain-like [Oopsacas minuta]|uniref:Spectrin alpha chain-like n=1 Tax=Oopsacas minuta TaxID=111878 RepID=A0AAV7KE95_9METZ|nr:Spectrin alpha chain-like [Oopsacas minuta]